MTKLDNVLSNTQQTLILYLSKLFFINKHSTCSLSSNNVSKGYLSNRHVFDSHLYDNYTKTCHIIRVPRQLIKFIHIYTPRSQSGFNLVELMVTVMILAIIVTIAAPAIQTQLASMEARRIKNQLETTLKTAKAESFIRRQNLLVCLSNSGGRCHRDSNNKLLLFVDNNDNKHFDVLVDFLLNEESLNPKYSTLSLRVGNRRHYTKFWGDTGKPRGHFGHIKYCPASKYSRAMYQISFNQGGIIKYKPNDIHPTNC